MITIIGAGLSGCLMALLLDREGFEVTLYEKRKDPRQHRFTPGKAINLSLTDASFRSLEHVGLHDLRTQGVYLEGNVYHTRQGERIYESYADARKANDTLLSPISDRWAIKRSILDAALVGAVLNASGIETHFNCTLVHRDAKTITLSDADGHRWTAAAEIVIGADGAFSGTRRALVQAGVVEESPYALGYGYKELHLPAGLNGNVPLRKSTVHFWPRQGHILVALPNPDGSFTCGLFMPLNGPVSFSSVNTSDQLEALFTRDFKDARGIIPDLQDEYFNHPLGTLYMVRCHPWFTAHTVLIGDACHALFPFTGQGVNQAFQDCEVLFSCIQTHASNWPVVFSQYAAQRKPETDRIADTEIIYAPYILSFLPEAGPHGQL